MKQYKHKITGKIAKECSGIYEYLGENQFHTHIPKELIENSSDWEKVIEKKPVFIDSLGNPVYKGEKYYHTPNNIKWAFDYYIELCDEESGKIPKHVYFKNELDIKNYINKFLHENPLFKTPYNKKDCKPIPVFVDSLGNEVYKEDKYYYCWKNLGVYLMECTFCKGINFLNNHKMKYFKYQKDALDYINLMKRKPITKDHYGHNIFKNEKIYWVTKDEKYYITGPYSITNINSWDSSWFLFSKLEDAQAFVDKTNRKPIFTTIDGVDVYKKDHYKLYWICKEKWDLGFDKADLLDENWSNHYWYFSTKEAVQEYIIENKPVLSYKELEKLGNYNTNILFSKKQLKDQIKQKLGYE